jgi:isocitrate lyase
MLRQAVRGRPGRVIVSKVPSVVASRVRWLSGTPKWSMPPSRTPSVPAADHFQLLPELHKAGQEEDALYEGQIKDVEAWWQSERYAGITRPYSAADVVSKRGTVQQQYPSSLMARKLFNLIKERSARRVPIHTSQFQHVKWQESRMKTDFTTQWAQLILSR